MILEMIKGNKKINAYEYRDRPDIEEAIIPDSVESIGEGAFKNCRNLTRIRVGRSVKQINVYAFDGIGKKLDIVWLSPMLYQSPFMKILPGFDDIDSICAPKRNFSKAGDKEKRALLCGYLLHPEYEQEYTEEAKAEYKRYMEEDFVSHFNELCDRGMIMKIFLACYERKMLESKELFRQFISYIKSKPMTKEEKEQIEAIEEKENISSAGEDELTKKLRRYIRTCITEKELQEVLLKEGIKEVPDVLFRSLESDRVLHPAPAEALKFILASYISQWTYLEKRPSGFHVSEEADDVAELLEKDRLKHVLEKMAEQAGVRYPRLLVPFLRYADGKQVEKYIKISEMWKQYDIYGEEGILAKDTFEKAVLLNDSEDALLHAYRQDKLKEYAFQRKRNVEDLFLKIAVVLEQKNLTEELHLLYERYVHKLHVDYLSGSKVKKTDWIRWNLTHPSIRDIAKTLVWQKAEKNGKYFVVMTDEIDTWDYGIDENGIPVCLEDNCEICLAHPVFMDYEQIRGFQKILEEKGVKQCFSQLKHIKAKLDLGDWELWNRRYYKMELSYEKLQELTAEGFRLDGSKSERIRISFYGKVLMEAFPTEKKDVFRLGYILGSNYNMREINESVALLDDAFCYEMILAGRMEAAPYLERFDEKQIETLLEASIELEKKENIAVLLEYKAKLVDKNDDLEFVW